jgi:hypothetical protein
LFESRESADGGWTRAVEGDVAASWVLLFTYWRKSSGEKQVARLERRLLDKVEHLLADPAVWRATELIAAELPRCTTISGRAARHLFSQSAAQTE